MLVLGRKVNEEIDITVGDVTVRIAVVAIMRGKVRIGIEAPRECGISRPDAKHRRRELEPVGE
jgi:carbon storage regulator CsrA